MPPLAPKEGAVSLPIDADEPRFPMRRIVDTDDEEQEEGSSLLAGRERRPNGDAEDAAEEGEEDDEEVDMFQRASRASGKSRFVAVVLFLLGGILLYHFVVPILPDLIPERDTPWDDPVQFPQRDIWTLDGRVDLPLAYVNHARLASSLSEPEGEPASTDLNLLHIDPEEVSAVFEKIFLQSPSPGLAEKISRELTRKTHIAGSKRDFETAVKVARKFSDALGTPLADKPKDFVFDAGSSDSIRHMTQARRIGGDPINEGRPRVWVDTYSVWLNYPVSSSLALTRKGEAEPYFHAKLEEDKLEEDKAQRQGRGAITLCRYGGPFRGLKVRMSAEHGAVGTLIYSDPNEDGEVTEANGYQAYPDGPARQPSSVQRGSVQGLSIYPGDPSTPGKPSYRNATRLDPDTADSLPKIPSLPLSYEDAKPLLESLKGRGVKASDVGDGWQGAIPGVEYWTGPSEDQVDMSNEMTKMETRDTWNTYAYIPGILEDEVVVLSNHRDAWTFGAGDPSSGTVALTMVAAGLGNLVKKGWRPLRSILLASWDGEEYGLVGSTEAAEDYRDFFKRKGSVFLNVDVAASGPKPNARASPSLSDFVVGAARDIHSDSPNQPGLSLAHPPGPLGSGSDYTAFLQNLGIASVDMGFARGTKDPVYHYHSNYDNFHWMKKFGDPHFERHVDAAKWQGLMALRASQSIFLPINATRYADALEQYLDKFVKLPGADAIDVQPSQRRLQRHNKRSKRLELNFIDEAGLAKRPFYKHLGVAPGRYLGYGSTTFPGLTEAVSLDGGGQAAEEEKARLVETLERVATGLLEGL
ncbi:hypothetical protein L7F22_038238 [Adiantum nelumboides]|nr:hypothetical protein [Adiantum nelumboides]